MDNKKINLTSLVTTTTKSQQEPYTYLYFKMEVPSVQFRTTMSRSNIAEDKLLGKYITSMWSCMKWHDTVHSCMVYTEHAEVAAVSCGTSHVTTKQCCKYITLVDIPKSTIRCNSHSFRITHDKSAVSLLESRAQHYVKAIIIFKKILIKRCSLISYHRHHQLYSA